MCEFEMILSELAYCSDFQPRKKQIHPTASNSTPADLDRQGTHFSTFFVNHGRWTTPLQNG